MMGIPKYGIIIISGRDRDHGGVRKNKKKNRIRKWKTGPELGSKRGIGD